MADEKLHPEVEALIRRLSADETERLSMDSDTLVRFCNALSAVATLAASKAREEQQAKIDRLMLEYCPDEMTPEQLAEWGRNQKPASKEWKP